MSAKIRNKIKIVAIILIAGRGKRFSKKILKQYTLINNKPLVYYSLLQFSKLKEISEIILVCPQKDKNFVKNAIINKFNFAKVKKIIAGGKKRADSVYFGLKACSKNTKIVLIHDGARPVISEKLIKETIVAAKKYHSAIPVIPVDSTVKKIADQQIKTVDRNNLFLAQTPQTFNFKLLFSLFEKAKKLKLNFTDEATLLEYFGIKPKTVSGETKNLKLTTKKDLELIKALLNPKDLRIGQGFDIHKLVPKRKLFIGGLHIQAEQGALGHSDADVLVHAIIDAILGACGLNDIGSLFPDTDKKYKNIRSTILLKQVANKLETSNFQLTNIDSTIYLQQPKLRPYIEKIRKNLAEILKLDKNNLNIKAKTFEKLSIIGEEKAIAAEAVALVQKNI
jgi:2-C-methyl-D-erythritol 4-phosphate cytidylyltransferase/2-C-methyl-D-erythritol 2,4-cyclodiphosphate synthase